jgi:hypothetical protein
MSDIAVANGLAVHPGRSARTLKIYFTEPVTFGFSGFLTRGRSMPKAERSKLGPEWCSLLIRTVCSVNVSFAQFLSEAHLGVADGRPEGPGWYSGQST